MKNDVITQHRPIPPAFDHAKWDYIALARMNDIWWNDYLVGRAPCYCSECFDARMHQTTASGVWKWRLAKTFTHTDGETYRLLVGACGIDSLYKDAYMLQRATTDELGGARWGYVAAATKTDGLYLILGMLAESGR